MSKTFIKKPALIYNNIPEQLKTAANSLTIQDWNQVVNVLKRQINLNTEYLEKLHRLLFSDWGSDTTGFLDFAENIDTDGLLKRILVLIEDRSYLEHRHDEWYYTETEVDVYLDTKSDVGHTHSTSDIIDLVTFMTNQPKTIFTNNSIEPETNTGDFWYDAIMLS